MKARNVIAALTICLAGLTMFPACLDVETTSTVNPDCSIVRTITFEGDSNTVYSQNLPVVIDSSWHREVQKLDARKFRLTVSKLFDDVSGMNAALRGTSGKTLQFHFELDRSFQWFFTKYRYVETNLRNVQFEYIPLTDYVSPSEIKSWEEHEVEKKAFATKGDSLAWKAAEPRFEQWESRNVFEAIFNTFLDGVNELHSPLLSASSVIAHKDTLFKESEESLEMGGVDTLEVIFTRILKSTAVRTAWQLKAPAFREIKSKRELNFADDTFVTNVIMPGLIVASNARTIEGNKATWRDFSDYARILGYTMWVESRQVNWWAVILTGLIVAFLAAFLVLSSVRRRRML